MKTYIYLVDVTCRDCRVRFQRDRHARKGWQGRCHRCARIEVCRSRAGKVASDPIRSKVYVDVKCSDCGKSWKKREDSLTVWGGKCRACGNGKRNPDRAEVERNDRARKEMYSLIHNTLRRVGRAKDGKSAELLGYSASDLYKHLTRSLREGMSWDRRGEWHIDHVKPVSLFVKEGVTDPKVINALTNLQPLWSSENMAKGGFRAAAK